MMRLFITIWFLAYLIYPTWLIGASFSGRLFVFTGLMIYLFITGVICSRMSLQSRVKGEDMLLEGRHRGDYFAVGLLLLANSFLHLIPLQLPIISGGDQHYHAYAAIPLLEILSRFSSRISPFSIHTVFRMVFLGIALFIIFRRLFQNHHAPNKVPFWVFMSFFVGFYIYFWALIWEGTADRLGDLFIHVFRFPPLGKLVYMVWYGLFGVSEMTAHSIQLFFVFLATLFLYRLSRLTHDPWIALGICALFIYSPIIYFFSHIAYLEGGVLFFVISASFYYLRFVLKGRESDLFLAMGIVGIGYLYKEIVAGMYIVFLIHQGLNSFQQGASKKTWAPFAKASLVAIGPILPWWMMSQAMSLRPYTLSIGNGRAFQRIYGILVMLPATVTWVTVVLFCIGFLQMVFRKRKVLSTFAVSWFLFYLIFVGCEVYGHLARLMLVAYPAIFILAGEAMKHLFQRCPSRATIALILLFVVFMSAYLTIDHLRPFQTSFYRVEKYDPTSQNTAYLPYPELFRYVREKFPSRITVYAPMFCEPSHFYLSRYRLSDRILWERKKWIELSQQTMDNLYEYCKEKKASLFVFPVGTISETYIHRRIQEALLKGLDRRFREIQHFTNSHNELALVKVVL